MPRIGRRDCLCIRLVDGVRAILHEEGGAGQRGARAKVGRRKQERRVGAGLGAVPGPGYGGAFVGAEAKPQWASRRRRLHQLVELVGHRLEVRHGRESARVLEPGVIEVAKPVVVRLGVVPHDEGDLGWFGGRHVGRRFLPLRARERVVWGFPLPQIFQGSRLRQQPDI